MSLSSKKTIRSRICLVLVVCLLVGMVPFGALAATQEVSITGISAYNFRGSDWFIILNVDQGVTYYNTLSEMKKTAVPYFPMGFTNFGDRIVCAGLKEDIKINLAVWNLMGEQDIIVPISESITNAKIAYPTKTSVKLDLCKDGIRLTCPETPCAVFLEITI